MPADYDQSLASSSRVPDKLEASTIPTGSALDSDSESSTCDGHDLDVVPDLAGTWSPHDNGTGARFRQTPESPRDIREQQSHSAPPSPVQSRRWSNRSNGTRPRLALRSLSGSSITSFVKSASSAIRRGSFGSQGSKSENQSRPESRMSTLSRVSGTSSQNGRSDVSTRETVKRLGGNNEDAGVWFLKKMTERWKKDWSMVEDDEMDSIMGKIWARFKQRNKSTARNPAPLDPVLQHILGNDEVERLDPEVFFQEEEGSKGDCDVPIEGRIDSTISSSMSVYDIISILHKHGCPDITLDLDTDNCGTRAISGGGFGDIYAGRLRNGLSVAIKCARLFVDSTTGNRNMLKVAARELYTWSKCDDSHVIKLLGVAQFRDQIAMVSPWMENGTLPRYLNENSGVSRNKLCRHVAMGVEYLHKINIIHGDIKGANVLISELGHAKLTDFGSSTLKSHTIDFSGASHSPDFSLRWAAP
ncbi:kinase-like protein [Ceratobasidium sp. AG-I]|nr:kinase-like protein [Ceratobasidium sp. AG-I]